MKRGRKVVEVVVEGLCSSMFLELNIKATRGKNGCTRSGATQSVLHI